VFSSARHFANFCLLIPKSYGYVVMWILVDHLANFYFLIPKTYGCSNVAFGGECCWQSSKNLQVAKHFNVWMH
jgi:hypothetical protein